jgi:hypothetical protein
MAEDESLIRSFAGNNVARTSSRMFGSNSSRTQSNVL